MAFCASGSGAATIVTGMARVVATQQHEEGESAEQRQKNHHGQHAKRREQGRHQTSAAAADIPGSFGRDMEPQCACRALGLVVDRRHHRRDVETDHQRPSALAITARAAWPGAAARKTVIKTSTPIA